MYIIVFTGIFFIFTGNDGRHVILICLFYGHIHHFKQI